MDVWVAKEDGTEIVRAQDIAAVSLDYNGNVTARLASGGALVTLVENRTNDEHPPEHLHRELIRILAELSDASGGHMVRPVHHETRGWEWVSERF